MNLEGSMKLCPFNEIKVVGLLTSAYKLHRNGLLARLRLSGINFLLCSGS